MKNLIILLLLAISSCTPLDESSDPFAQDPNPPLPPITTQGLNKLGCLIDGKVYVSSIPPGSGVSGLYSFDMGYGRISNKISINTYWITKDQSTYKGLSFRFCEFSKNRDFCEQNLNGGVAVRNYLDYSDIDKKYFIDYNLPSEFKVVHFDSTKRILSGTFSFFLVDKVHNDTLTVTKGRFDGKFRF